MNSVINLLPSSIKQNYRYARRNRRLVFWSFAFLLATIGVFAITVGGLLIMNGSMDTKKSEISQIQARLDSQDLASVEREATNLSGNLELMVNVLSREVLFSKLLVQLGNITPPNVILTDLSIAQTEDAIDITARATNYNSAAQLQANLADPDNRIFSQTDIVTINCSDGEDAEGIAARYPCSVTIRALFSDDNSFLFINTDEEG